MQAAQALVDEPIRRRYGEPGRQSAVDPLFDSQRTCRYLHVVLSSIADLDARGWSRVFRALGDETRVRIVALLSHGELCVCHVEKALALPQPLVSRHLSVLRAAGVVDSRREGTWVYYSLAAQPDAQIQAVIDGVSQTFSAQRTVRTDLSRVKKSCGPGACS
jgi:ArsR family transcriptional regulator